MSGAATRRPGLVVVAAATLTAGAMALVVWQPFRLEADDWAWLAVARPEWTRTIVPLVVYALIGSGVLAAWRRIEHAGRLAEAVVVAVLVALAFLAQVAVGRQPAVGYLEGVFAVGLPRASAYHAEALRVEREGKRLGEHLRGFEREVGRRPFRVQLSTHPAGPVVLFWGLNHVFAGRKAAARRFVRRCERWLAEGTRIEDSEAAAALFAKMTAAQQAGAWLATIVLRVAACLVLVPVYLMARRLHGRRAALMAAALSAAIPSLLLFSPGLDQTYPVLALTAFWLAYSAGEQRSGWRAMACGLVVSAGLFLTLAFGIVGLLSGLLAIAGLRRGEERAAGSDWAKLLAGGTLGLLAPIAALEVAFGYKSLAVWWACWQGNAEFNARTQRGYWTWLLLNPVEFGVALGVPVACLFVGRTLSEAWAVARGRLGGRDWPVVLVAGLLVALNVLGANRGEVPRLWMFLMPACAIGAATEIRRYMPYSRAVFTAVYVLQCVQVVVFKASVNALGMK